MNREFEKNLIDSLDLLDQGMSVEAVLARYPDQAAELRPYLETAAQVSGLASQPTIAAQKRSQASFLAAASAMKNPQSSPLPIWFTLRRLLMPVASLAVILFLFGFSLVAISGSALPGDGLYNAKRVVEGFRMSIASDPDQIMSLSEQFQQERLREIEALLLAGKTAHILFEGEIETIGPAAWNIAGLSVQLEDDTIVEGAAKAGELARVDGRTVSGRLLAKHIAVLTGAPELDETPLPAVLPTIRATEMMEPSATPAPTETPAVSPTPSPTSEATLTPTATATATETIVPSPPPPTDDRPDVAPPTNEDDTGNENDDDGDNNDDGNNNDDENNDNSGDDSSGNENEDAGDDGADTGNDNGDEDNSNEGDTGNENGEEDNSNEGDTGNENGEEDNSNEGDDANDNSGDNENGDDQDNSNEGDSAGDDNYNGDDNDNDNGDDNDNDNGDDNGDDSGEGDDE